MALIFNSIIQFEIQPERTKRRVKRDDLDTLSEVWVGPSDQEDTFVPRIGSVHPSYNLMTVLNTSIKRMPAYVSEVTINYQGKLDSGGAGSYTSVPTINLYWAEGEISYDTNHRVTINQFTYPGVLTVSRRYTGRCCTVAYITNRLPSGSPTNLGLDPTFLGFTNVWEINTGFRTGDYTSQDPPITQLTCTDVKVEDKADSWYRVTETYQSKQFPGAIHAPPSFISIKAQVSSGANTGAASDSHAQVAAGVTAYTHVGGAVGDLPSSTDAVGKDTTQATGIDPTWPLSAVPVNGTPIPGTTQVAASTLAFWTNPDTQSGSTPLDY